MAYKRTLLITIGRTKYNLQGICKTKSEAQQLAKLIKESGRKYLIRKVEPDKKKPNDGLYWVYYQRS